MNLPAHILIFGVYAYSLFVDVVYVSVGHTGFGWRFKYLTFINLLLQTVYFGLSVFLDLRGSVVKPSDGGRKSKLQNFLDVYFAALVYPIGIFVVMTFWGIYAVDRELVYPKHLDTLIPQWLNHSMHTAVLPFLLIEKYLVYHQYPTRRRGILTLLVFAFLYLCWILWIAFYADLWVYPVLKIMEPHQRAIFIFVLMCFFVSIYIVGEALNKALWRKEHAIAKTVKQGQSGQKRRVKKIS